jgi:glc operon protein GlcG
MTHQEPLPSELLLNEVVRLFPSFMEDPVDAAQCRGNAGVYVLDPSGRVFGHVFGTDKVLGRQFLGLAHRKALQVWSTGYATGRFEELVYAGKLDECQFGVNRPDFIGWEGGVAFVLPDGSLLAAGFSGFRGVNDVAILKRAAASVPGLKAKED